MTVLITGATSGIGEEFVHYYAKRGHDVFLLGRNVEKLQELKAQYPYHVKACYVVDLSKDTEVDVWLKSIQNQAFDVVINNAGFGYIDEFAKTDLSLLEDMIEVNVTSLTKICHGVLQPMIARKTGYILNVASVASFVPGPYMATYYATKHYVRALSEALAQEVKKHQITVSCLCPGPIETNFWKTSNSNQSRSIKGVFTHHVSELVLRCIQAMVKKKKVIIPFFSDRLLITLTSILPRSISLSILGSIQKGLVKKGKYDKMNKC